LATACSTNNPNVLRTNLMTQRLESDRCTEYDPIPEGGKYVGAMSLGLSPGTMEHSYFYAAKDGEVRQLGCKNRETYNANTLLLFTGENDQMWKCVLNEEFYRHFYTGLTADIPVSHCREVKP
jgi:hypothetical protein